MQHDQGDDSEHDGFDQSSVDADEVRQRGAFVVVLELDELGDFGHPHQSGQLEDPQQLVEAGQPIEDESERDRGDEVEEEVAHEVVLGDDPAVGDDPV